MAILAFSLFCAGGQVTAQARRIIEVPRHGVEVFANLLHEQGLRPLADADAFAQVAPEKSLLVVLGKLDRLDEAIAGVGGLRRYLRAGGAILIASDYESENHLAPLGLGISGIAVRQQPEAAFPGFPACPILPVPPIRGKAHPVFQDLHGTVVTMRPSTFSAIPDRWARLAFYPDQTYLPGIARNLGPFGFPWILASPPDAQDGSSVLAITGHGVFMNCFLVLPDYDNFRFARNVARHMAEGPKGRRTHVLLLDEGVPLERLDLSLESPPLPIGFLLNTLIDQAQRQGLIDEVLRRSLPHATMWRWMLFLLTSLVFPFVFRRFFVSRFRRDARAALIVGLNEVAPPTPSVSRRRREEILSRSQFAESARILARQWLRERGVAELAVLPPYEVRASWLRRWKLHRSLAWIGRLVRGELGAAVSARRLRALLATLAELTRAAEIGEIRFVSPVPNPRKD